MTPEALGRVHALALPELRAEWRRVHKSAPPAAFTANLLIRGITYRLQEQSLGKLPIEFRRELDQLAGIGAKTAHPDKKKGPLRQGSRLVRRWRGISYSVTVLDGEFEYHDRRYRSLSEIAREITGTRWSGPRFFGLRSAP